MFDTEIYHRVRRALYRLEPVAQLLQIDDETQRQTLFIDSGVGFVIIFVVIVVVIIVVIVVVVRVVDFVDFVRTTACDAGSVID
jgi:tetrahydromethanopterin S-methyltransferase subunit C